MNPGNGFLIFIVGCTALWLIGQKFNFGNAWNAGLGRTSSSSSTPPAGASQAPGTSQTFPLSQLSFAPPAIPYSGVSIS